MDKNNPAIFECKSNYIHTWKKTNYGAICVNCHLRLTHSQFKEIEKE